MVVGKLDFLAWRSWNGAEVATYITSFCDLPEYEVCLSRNLSGSRVAELLSRGTLAKGLVRAGICDLVHQRAIAEAVRRLQSESADELKAEMRRLQKERAQASASGVKARQSRTSLPFALVRGGPASRPWSARSEEMMRHRLGSGDSTSTERSHSNSRPQSATEKETIHALARRALQLQVQLQKRPSSAKPRMCTPLQRRILPEESAGPWLRNEEPNLTTPRHITKTTLWMRCPSRPETPGYAAAVADLGSDSSGRRTPRLYSRPAQAHFAMSSTSPTSAAQTRKKPTPPVLRQLSTSATCTEEYHDCDGGHEPLATYLERWGVARPPQPPPPRRFRHPQPELQIPEPQVSVCEDQAHLEVDASHDASTQPQDSPNELQPGEESACFEPFAETSIAAFASATAAAAISAAVEKAAAKLAAAKTTEPEADTGRQARHASLDSSLTPLPLLNFRSEEARRITQAVLSESTARLADRARGGAVAFTRTTNAHPPVSRRSDAFSKIDMDWVQCHDGNSPRSPAENQGMDFDSLPRRDRGRLESQNVEEQRLSQSPRGRSSEQSSSDAQARSSSRQRRSRSRSPPPPAIAEDAMSEASFDDARPFRDGTPRPRSRERSTDRDHAAATRVQATQHGPQARQNLLTPGMLDLQAKRKHLDQQIHNMQENRLHPPVVNIVAPPDSTPPEEAMEK